MASHAFLHSEETAPAQGFVRLAEARRLLDQIKLAVPVTHQVANSSELPSTALGGARGAITALGLEAFAVVYLCAIWLLARAF
jgi:hypothetical protein